MILNQVPQQRKLPLLCGFAPVCDPKKWHTKAPSHEGLIRRIPPVGGLCEAAGEERGKARRLILQIRHRLTEMTYKT
jgi:hypothetical protein